MRKMRKKFNHAEPDERFRISFYNYVHNAIRGNYFLARDLLYKWKCCNRVILLDAIYNSNKWEDTNFAFNGSWHEANILPLRDVLVLCRKTREYIKDAIENESESAASYVYNIADPVLSYHVLQQPASDALATECLEIIKAIANIDEDGADILYFIKGTRDRFMKSFIKYIVDTCNVSPEFFIDMIDSVAVPLEIIRALGMTDGGEEYVRHYLKDMRENNLPQFIDIYLSLFMDGEYYSLEPCRSIFLASPQVASYYESLESPQKKLLSAIDAIIYMSTQLSTAETCIDELAAEFNKYPSKLFLRKFVEYATNEYEGGLLEKFLSRIDFSCYSGNFLEDVAYGVGGNLKTRKLYELVDVIQAIVSSDVPLPEQYNITDLDEYSLVVLLVCVMAMGGKDKLNQALDQIKEAKQNLPEYRSLNIDSNDIAMILATLAYYYTSLYKDGAIELDAVKDNMGSAMTLLGETFENVKLSKARAAVKSRLKNRISASIDEKEKEVLEAIIAAISNK